MRAQAVAEDLALDLLLRERQALSAIAGAHHRHHLERLGVGGDRPRNGGPRDRIEARAGERVLEQRVEVGRLLAVLRLHDPAVVGGGGLLEVEREAARRLVGRGEEARAGRVAKEPRSVERQRAEDLVGVAAHAVEDRAHARLLLRSGVGQERAAALGQAVEPPERRSYAHPSPQRLERLGRERAREAPLQATEAGVDERLRPHHVGRHVVIGPRVGDAAPNDPPLVVDEHRLAGGRAEIDPEVGVHQRASIGGAERF